MSGFQKIYLETIPFLGSFFITMYIVLFYNLPVLKDHSEENVKMVS